MSSFTTKARTVELLGRKQIRDSVTAIAELMKNSYDADAPSLRVEFNTLSENPRVIIADSGTGMSKDNIEKKWLVLGTNSKTHRRVRKTDSGRPLMGAKGIGRLAASAVGRQLWMFTKTADSLWNIVYIHWGLFENPKLGIHEIIVPTRFGIPRDELVLRFNDIISDMKAEVLKNFEKDAWHIGVITNNDVTDDNESAYAFISDLKSEILADVQTSGIDRKHIDKFLMGYSQGTVLYIEKLHDNWDKYLSPISSEARKDDPISEKMHNRFASFVSTLNSAESPEISWNVEIYYNNKLWETAFSYTDEDYNIYDIKVEGRIVKGKFFGRLDACNANPNLLKKCNEILSQGLDVTSGIADWESKDCGAFTIKFCHVEGSENRSGLSADDYNRIKAKLEISRGICVYRDGVRILPYGEPENDFLRIEARRTEKASRYVFSHRNIFGRIDIDSVNNPLLEDKSSREGLIENIQYHYFVKVIENLLVTLAIEYISNVRKDSLAIQNSYVEYNKARSEQEKIKNALEKKEDAQLNKLKRDAAKWLSSIPAILQSKHNAVQKYCLEQEGKHLNLTAATGLNQLDLMLDSVQLNFGKIKRDVDSLLDNSFLVPELYIGRLDEELLFQIDTQNKAIQVEHGELSKKIDNCRQQLYARIQILRNDWIKSVLKLTRTTPEKLKESLYERLSLLVNEHRHIQDAILGDSLKNRHHLLAKLQPVEEYLAQLESTADILGSAEWIDVQNQIELLTSLRNKIDKMFDHTPEAAAQSYSDITAQIDQANSALLNAMMRLRHKDNSVHVELAKIQEDLSDAISGTAGEITNQQIAAFLRQENLRLEAELDVYSDLANMGLAAEIVSHEFNQLFINVNNAIKNMAPYVRDPNAKYWLKQIDMGFRSISDRQNQLSPIYRTYSLRKAKTNLHDFIDEIHKFTESELIRNSVTLINEVPESIDIVLSKSKLFPAISNMINNSVYWVLNKAERVILFRYEESSRTLYIEDSGAGITAAHKEKIFEPFVSFKPNGRGLGLTVAKKVIESQGHKLEIASDKEKTLSGACFKIIFSEDAIGE